MRLWTLLLLTAVTACGGDGRCPQIGCVSALTVQLPAGTSSARACVAEVCSDVVTDGEVQVPLSRRGDATSVAVTVELTDAAGVSTTLEGQAPVQLSRPNGAGCPPVCINGEVRVDLASSSLVPA